MEYMDHQALLLKERFSQSIEIPEAKTLSSLDKDTIPSELQPSIKMLLKKRNTGDWKNIN